VEIEAIARMIVHVDEKSTALSGGHRLHALPKGRSREAPEFVGVQLPL
jgi:hypothetical protein